MPMDFPDFNSLKEHAKIVKFRQPIQYETEQWYRSELANHVKTMGDLVESEEIRNGIGWDKWTDVQKQLALLRNIKN